MGFFIENRLITFTAMLVFLLIYIGLRYRLPPPPAPENIWHHANRYQQHFPGLKGKAIKWLLRFALVLWPAFVLVNALLVLAQHS